MGSFCSGQSGKNTTKQNETGQIIIKVDAKNQLYTLREEQIIESQVPNQNPEEQKGYPEPSNKLISEQAQNPDSNQQFKTFFQKQDAPDMTDVQKAMEPYDQLVDIGTTGKPGMGIIEMLDDCFIILNKLIEQLGPAYTKLYKEDQNR